MTAKADQNPIHGIEQLFAGLVPDTDARAFQSSPAPRSAWRVVSSDGSRSEAEVRGKETGPPPKGGKSRSTVDLSVFEKSIRTAAGESDACRIALPKVNAQITDLAEAWPTYCEAEAQGATCVPAGEGVSVRAKRTAETPTDTGAVQSPRQNGRVLRASGVSSATTEAAPSLKDGSDPHEDPRATRSRESYELARVVQSWGRLTPEIRNAILAIIDSL